MKKITIAIIIGILLLGIGTATFVFGLDKKDFKTKVDKISAEEFCEKVYDEDKDKDKIKFKKCKDKDYEVEVPDDFILQNQQGVYMIG